MSASKRVAQVQRYTSVPHWLLLLVGYFLLTLAATFPLIHLFGVTVLGGGDTVQNLWNLWWGDLAIRQGNWLPFHTTQIYYPDGVSLAYHTLGPVNLWLGSILHSGFGLNLAATYNTITVFTFVLSALGMHWLVYELTRSHSAAFVAAVIFVFSPIRMSRLYFGNLNLYSTEWIPFALFFAVRSWQRRRLVDAVFAGVFVALTAGVDLFLALGTALLLALLCLGYFVFGQGDVHERLKTLLPSAAVLLLTTAILSLPFVLPVLTDAADFPGQGDQLAVAQANNADLLAFFVPDSVTSPLFTRASASISGHIEAIYAQFHGNRAEKSVFIGYGVLALLLIALFRGLSRQAWPWLASTLLLFLLALGPTLYVAGQALVPHMPFEWLSHLPVLGINRSPSRYALFAMLSLAVTIGYGLAAWTLPRRQWVSVIVGLLIFAEFWIAPIRVDGRLSQMPAFYAQIAHEPAPAGIVFDVPVDMIGAQGPAAEYMLFQTRHQRPIVSGYVARTPQSIAERIQEPLYFTLRARVYGNTAPFVLDDAFLAQLPDELHRLDVAFLVLHRWALAPADFDTLYSAFSTTFTVPVYQDDQISVWQLK